MKIILIVSIFLSALVSNVQYEPDGRLERQKRSVFDIIPVTRKAASEDLPNIAAGKFCQCKRKVGFCVFDAKGRCRRVLGRGGKGRVRGGSIYRRRRHQKMKFQKWLKLNASE